MSDTTKHRIGVKCPHCGNEFVKIFDVTNYATRFIQNVECVHKNKGCREVFAVEVTILFESKSCALNFN